MRVFLSYHRKDTRFRKKVIEIFKENGISYYAVPEEVSFDGEYHQHIKDQIISKMGNCTTVLCLVGRETYQRAHVDWELYTGLKGGVGKRKGLLAVMLETRDDNKNDIDYETFPPRIVDNEEYAVIEQFASLHDRLLIALEEAEDNRNDENLQVDNTRSPMPLRSKKYYEN